MPRVFQHKRSTAVVDDSHPPLLITTWFGAPNAHTIAQVFQHIRNRLDVARAHDEKWVQVVDATRAATPTSSTRQAAADQLNLMEVYKDVWLGPWHLAVSSRVAAAVITAVNWLTRKQNDYEVYYDTTVALDAAAQWSASHLGVHPRLDVLAYDVESDVLHIQADREDTA